MVVNTYHSGKLLERLLLLVLPLGDCNKHQSPVLSKCLALPLRSDGQENSDSCNLVRLALIGKTFQICDCASLGWTTSISDLLAGPWSGEQSDPTRGCSWRFPCSEIWMKLVIIFIIFDIVRIISFWGSRSYLFFDVPWEYCTRWGHNKEGTCKSGHFRQQVSNWWLQLIDIENVSVG